MPDTFQIRRITADELERIPEMDVSDESETIFVQTETHIERREEAHSQPQRSREDWSDEIREWQEFVRAGDSAFGAFVGNQLVGVAVLRRALSEGTDQLAGLYVHRPWRRNAVAGSLLQRVVETARAGGAKRLYVSATRSESAVGFYTTSGFTPIAVADAELFEREPDDIHMERPL